MSLVTQHKASLPTQQATAAAMLERKGLKRSCHSAFVNVTAKRLKHSNGGEKFISHDEPNTRKRPLAFTTEEREAEVSVAKRWRPSDGASSVVPSRHHTPHRGASNPCQGRKRKPSPTTTSESLERSDKKPRLELSCGSSPFGQTTSEVSTGWPWHSEEERSSSSGIVTSSEESSSEGLRPDSQQLLTACSTLHSQGVRLLHSEEMQAFARLGQKVVGAGGFGSCHKVVDPLTSNEIVIKTLFDQDLDVLLTEAINLQQLQMEGVQRLYGVCVDTYQLVTHFAGDTANDYFEVCRSPADTASVFLQVARALQQINRKGFTHNDLKGSNVCIAATSTGPVATIIDVGLATRVGARDLHGSESDVSHMQWVAPELRNNTHPTSEASDVYSLARMMQRVLRLKKGCPCPPTQAALVCWLFNALSPHPEERPTLEALVGVLEVLLDYAKKA